MISKQKIKYIHSLQQKKFRNENGVYIAEGLKMVSEAIESPMVNIIELYFTPSTKESLPLAKLVSANAYEVSVNEFERLSEIKSPQGAMAIVEIPKISLPSAKEINDLVLVLDKIRDPGNLGTIIRLADWFGIKTIICSPDTVDCYNPKVVQATMGAIFRVNCYYADLSDYIKKAGIETDFTIYSTTLSGENLYHTQLQKKSMLILGNEANGISPELTLLTHKELHIPAFNFSGTGSESLNVSLAAAIICSEFRRQENIDYSK